MVFVCQNGLWLGAPQGISPSYQIYWPGHCVGGDIIVLSCHVMSQDYVIKGSCDFIIRSPSR